MDTNTTCGLTAERMTALRDNFARVTETIKDAERRSSNSGVILAAATKYALADEINYAHRELGLKVIGENRVQALGEKYDTLDKSIEIHLIGSLQTNKVKYIVGRVELVQSLDSMKLAKEICTQSKKLGIKTKVLAEVNIGEEENKGGIMPTDLEAMLEGFSQLEDITLCGLMTMAPVCDSDGYRRYFTRTRELFEKYKSLFETDSPILSMGMSNSYVEAVECGATMVRVGSALFR